MREISVLVPVFNGEAYLNSCVQSILAQSVDSQVIIHDDCSTDNTQEVARYLAFNYDNVKYVKSEANSGSADHAIGEYMKECKTPYFTWIGVDDYYARNALQSLINSLEQSDAHFAYSDFEVFGDLDLAPKGYGEFDQISKWDYYKHFHNTQLNLIPWNGVWKSDFLRSIPNPWSVYKNVGNHSDVMSGLYLFTQGAKVLHVPQKLIHYNLRASSGTHQLANRYYTLPHKLKMYYELLSVEELSSVHGCEASELLVSASKHCDVSVRRYINRLNFSNLYPKEHWQLKSFMLGLSFTDMLAKLKERIDAHV
jgi:glycosyltransferase involved in cell wall biosynthesis